MAQLLILRDYASVYATLEKLSFGRDVTVEVTNLCNCPAGSGPFFDVASEFSTKSGSNVFIKAMEKLGDLLRNDQNKSLRAETARALVRVAEASDKVKAEAASAANVVPQLLGLLDPRFSPDYISGCILVEAFPLSFLERYKRDHEGMVWVKKHIIEHLLILLNEESVDVRLHAFRSCLSLACRNIDVENLMTASRRFYEALTELRGKVHDAALAQYVEKLLVQAKPNTWNMASMTGTWLGPRAEVSALSTST